MKFRSVKTIMKSFAFYSLLSIVLISFSTSTQAQQVTGLDGVSIFIDPGHSQTENQGLYGYSEPEKVLRIGLALREMLQTQTDIDTVYMSRTTDQQQVPLGQRDDLANATGADFYYSIHSNAGATSTNNTLMLHGGWRSNGNTVEKTPNGGKAFGDILIEELTDAMRIPTIGNYADRTFYQGFPDNHSNKFPYLHVNRTTNMASVLSEGGFHTNPFQQKRNLNAEYKRLEAQAAFWTAIEYFGATERPVVGIATGVISNDDDGEPLNGATISIDGQSYTTDTFESLFNQYSSDPEELKNGFYYLEDLSNGDQQVIVSAEGFYSDTATVDVLIDDFSFHDVSLVSAIPPSITGFDITDTLLVNPGENLVLQFSRKMVKETVEDGLSFMPADSIRLIWRTDSRMEIITNELEFESNYVLKIDSTAIDRSSYMHQLDGNSDGVGGDSFVLNIETGNADIQSPVVSDIRPTNTRLNELNPIASASFNEFLDTSNLSSAIEIKKGTYSVPGTVKYYEVFGKSVINFFPSQRLDKSTNYILKLSGSISDTVGNALGSDINRTFPTSDQEISNEIVVDNFENGITQSGGGAWWEPTQSGSTVGIDPEATNVEIETDIVNLLTGSTQSMRINYGWRSSDSDHLIRVYRGSVTNPKFGNARILQSYVFGDGNGNKFRFVVRDGNGELEASEWYTVDWLGWKLISWDMANDEVVPWVNGNGTLNGTLYLDSYQLTYSQGQPSTGFILFDDLRAVEMGLATSNEDELFTDIPSDVELNQNYPNPFNPSTNITFGLPQNSKVDITVYDMLGRKVATVFAGTKPQGFHSVQFDASNLSSGIYIYQLRTDFGMISKQMTLLK
ncbi:T9SS type A sorting domain-containing protein [bacterium]|nr:T9SS type A sorting domain-containing protein [bacterium]